VSCGGHSCAERVWDPGRGRRRPHGGSTRPGHQLLGCGLHEANAGDPDRLGRPVQRLGGEGTQRQRHRRLTQRGIVQLDLDRGPQPLPYPALASVRRLPDRVAAFVACPGDRFVRCIEGKPGRLQCSGNTMAEPVDLPAQRIAADRRRFGRRRPPWPVVRWRKRPRGPRPLTGELPGRQSVPYDEFRCRRIISRIPKFGTGPSAKRKA